MKAAETLWGCYIFAADNAFIRLKVMDREMQPTVAQK
jgi:hypothetical protein